MNDNNSCYASTRDINEIPTYTRRTFSASNSRMKPVSTPSYETEIGKSKMATETLELALSSAEDS